MPTTNYSFGDLTNVTPTSGPTYENASDAGSAPVSANISGSFSDPGVNSPNVSSYFIRCRAFGRWTAEIDHDSPISPIPLGARITRVDVRQTFVSNAQSVDGDLTYVAGTPPYTTGCGVNIAIQMYPEPPNVLWQTDADEISVLVVDSAATNPGSVAASDTPPGEFIGAEYDFTTNPNGDFPNGYMSYADFLTNFSLVKWLINVFSSVSGSPTSGLTTITGNVAGNCFAELTLWRMEVDWHMPTEWTVTSDDPLVLPDNIITITRPDPGVAPEVDDELPESIIIGEKEIFPNDPWVILWTKTEISIHVPADEVTDPITISITLFDGVVPLGSVEVTTADLSGIYQLDEDATADTLYDHSGSTEDVAIPSPFFVTYFVDNKDTDVMHYTGSRMRIKGSGVAHQQFLSLDSINTESFGDLTLVPITNLSPFALANFIDQQCALRVYTTAIDEVMNVSQIVIFFKKLFTGYPQ